MQIFTNKTKLERRNGFYKYPTCKQYFINNFNLFLCKYCKKKKNVIAEIFQKKFLRRKNSFGKYLDPKTIL